MISRLLTIDPSKDCLSFLHDRVLSNNYRGLQISQHNRYTYEQVLGMIDIFYELVGESKMKIRTTDLKKRPENTPDEYIYAEYTNKVNLKFGKGTQDSIRKNLFVDFHRMGLINRYDKHNVPIDPYAARPVSSVSLTQLSLDLIDDSKTSIEKYMVFSQALDNLLLGLATDFFDVLADLDNLTKYEYTFFVSFLRQKLNGRYISLEEVIRYVKEFRSLSRFQRDAVIEIVQTYCNPDNFEGDKTNKRDFHNWTNETQQVFTLLNMTAYYQYNKTYDRIEFMVSPKHVFTTKDDVNKLKRSIGEKKSYFTEHMVDKKLGFELHHIVPLLWARNITEFFLLDKWENMLYIDGGIHAIITQSGNRHVKLRFTRENNDVVLSDPLNNKLTLKDSINVLYNSGLKKLMYDKNVELLSSF